MKYSITFFISLFGFLFCNAQDGTPDATFGSQGSVEINLTEFQDVAYQVKSNTNGRILVVGNPGNETGDVLFALHEDGSYDTSFGVSGILPFEYNSQPESVLKLLLFEDDSFLVLFRSAGLKFAKFLPDGGIDTSFGDQGYVSISSSIDFVRSLFEVEDTWLLAGYSYINGKMHIQLSRFLANGSLDATYANGGSVNYSIEQSGVGSLVFNVDQQHRITGMGLFRAAGYEQVFLVRFLENGGIDTAFGDGGISIQPYQPMDNALDIHMCFVSLPAGDYMMTLSEINPDELQSHFYFIKFDSFGNRILDFGNDGKKYGGPYSVSKLVLQPNGRLFVFGNHYQYEGSTFSLGRYFPEGNKDNSFTLQFNAFDQLGTDFILQPDGKGLILSYAVVMDPNSGFRLDRFHNNPLALPDTTFESWVLYPNPSKGQVYLKNSSGNMFPVDYSLYDVSGKLLKKSVFTEATPMLDMKELASGMYLLAVGDARFRLLKN